MFGAKIHVVPSILGTRLIALQKVMHQRIMADRRSPAVTAGADAQVLHGRVIGQNEAVTAVAKAVRRARAGLHLGAEVMPSATFPGILAPKQTEAFAYPSIYVCVLVIYYTSQRHLYILRNKHE